MNPRDHLRAAARCWEHAGFFAAAAERYHQAEAWRDAGRCFSLAERHNDAAVAYSRAGESLLAAREHLMAERPELARRLYEGIRSSAFLSFSAEVELLLTLGRVEEASRVMEDPAAMALFARLAAGRKRPDLAWLLQDENNGQSFATWNRSLRLHPPPPETKAGPIWPSVEFSQVSLLPIWHKETGGAVTGHRALDWSADGTFFVAALWDQGFARGQVAFEKVSLERWSLPSSTSCTKFLPKSSALLAGDHDGNVALVGKDGQIQTIESLRMPGGVYNIEFSNRGDHLAIASKGEDRAGALLKIFAWQGGQPRIKLTRHDGAKSNCLPIFVWAPDRTQVVWNPGPWNGGEPTPIRLNMLSNRGVYQLADAHQELVRNLRFTPDGRYLLSGSDDKTLVLRDGVTGQALTPPERFPDRIWGVAVHPQIAVVAVGEGRRLHLLRLHTGQAPQLSRLSKQVFTEAVASLSFSPDGRYLMMLTLYAAHLRLFRVNLKP